MSLGHSSGPSSRSQAAPSGMVGVLTAVGCRQKFTRFSWACRVATILPFTDALWDEISKHPEDITLANLMKEYSIENLTTLAESVLDQDSIDIGIFFALYVSPMCQSGSAVTLWPNIHQVKTDMRLEIPGPSKEIWEGNVAFLAGKYPDYAAHIQPQKEGAGEVGVVEGTSGRKGKGKGGKRARAAEQEAPKKTIEGDANFISKCPSACTSDTLLAIIVEGSNLQRISDKVNSLLREDEARCNLYKTELSPLLAEAIPLRRPLSTQAHVLDDKITEMTFDKFMVADNDKLAAIAQRCGEKRGAMLEAVAKIEHHRVECVALDISSKPGRDRATAELKKAEANVKKWEETYTKEEAEFNKQLDTVLEGLISLNVSKVQKVKARICCQKAELPLMRMEDTLRGLEDGSSVAMRELMEVVGELQFEVPKNPRVEGNQEVPLIDVDLLTDDPLPDSVPELQQMVLALRVNLAKEHRMREEQEQKVALEEEARKLAEATVAKMRGINQRLKDQVQNLKTPATQPTEQPTNQMNPKKLKLKVASNPPTEPRNNKSQGKQGKGRGGNA